MSRFRPAPRKGHLHHVKRIYSFLRNFKKGSIKFDTAVPDYSEFEADRPQWGHRYHGATEDIPDDAPEPKGKPVRSTTYVDENLLHDFVTGRSCTGILHLLNKTVLDYFCKRQNTVATATYGSELVAAQIGVDQIIDIRYTLRMLGVPLDGPAWMFGDNLAVVNSSTVPSGKLAKRADILNWHRVRESQAIGFVNFCYIKGTENPADILTKHTSVTNWYHVMKNLLDWRGNQNETDDFTEFERECLNSGE